MATRRSLLVHAGSFALPVLLLLTASAPAAGELSGSIGAATDYLYRGLTQTNGQPAVHASLHMQPAEGWSAGLWTSTVDLNRDGRTGFELDLHAARSWALSGDWTASVGLTFREYLREPGALDYDHQEINASLSFQERISASVTWSPNAAIYWRGPARGSAAAYELTIQQPLNSHWSVFAGAGRYDHEALPSDGYAYWSAGLTFTWSKLQLDVAHIGAEHAPTSALGYLESQRRWTGALTVRF